MAIGSARRLLRDLHLYVGLAAAPFVVLYAVSTMNLNHPGWAWGAEREAPSTSVAVRLPPGADSLTLGREALRQAGVSGEIMFVRRIPEEQRLEIPVQRPGEKITLQVDLAAGRAVVERQRTSFWSRLVFWHKMPGPHVVDLRGNWGLVALWRWMADASALSILFLAATGAYLWLGLKAERRTGWISLAGGLVVLAALVIGIVL